MRSVWIMVPAGTVTACLASSLKKRITPWPKLAGLASRFTPHARRRSICPVAVARNILASTVVTRASLIHSTGVVTIAVTSRQNGDMREVLVINPSALTMAVNFSAIAAWVVGIPLSLSTFSKSIVGLLFIIHARRYFAEIIGFHFYPQFF